jgi:hypothetical protein
MIEFINQKPVSALISWGKSLTRVNQNLEKQGIFMSIAQVEVRVSPGGDAV